MANWFVKWCVKPRFFGFFVFSRESFVAHTLQISFDFNKEVSMNLLSPGYFLLLF